MTLQLELSESLGVTRGSSGGDGRRRRAKIIAADIWGSSAYYPTEVLERDGPRVFCAGTQMYEDHLSETEKYDRPQGSVGKLIGKLISDAVFEANGPDGPGLYADVEFYESYLARINEIADDIGLSVRVQGITEEGEQDGRYGPIAVALLAATSVDVVTKAGAGGKLVSILESDRGLAGKPIQKQGAPVSDVTKEDFAAFTSKMTELMEALSETMTTVGASAAETATKVEELATKVEAPAEEDEDKAGTATEEVDTAAIVTAIAEAALPAAAAAPIIAKVKSGVSLEEAVKAETDYRDSLLASNESGTVVLQEGAKPTGLAYAVEILG